MMIMSLINFPFNQVRRPQIFDFFLLLWLNYLPSHLIPHVKSMATARKLIPNRRAFPSFSHRANSQLSFFPFDLIFHVCESVSVLILYTSLSQFNDVTPPSVFQIKPLYFYGSDQPIIIPFNGSDHPKGNVRCLRMHRNKTPIILYIANLDGYKSKHFYFFIFLTWLISTSVSSSPFFFFFSLRPPPPPPPQPPSGQGFWWEDKWFSGHLRRRQPNP